MKNLKIAIVDDHELFSDALKNVLPIYGISENIKTFINGNQLLNYLAGNKLDIVLLDLGIKEGMNGFETLKELKARNHQTKVIVISMHQQSEYIKRIKEMGGNGYLSKEAGTQELVYAIEHVCKNKTFYTTIDQSLNNPFNILSKAENRIAKELFTGLSNTEIGNKVFLSPDTISSHRKNIYKKLNVNSIVEYLKLGIKHGMISDNI